MNTYPSAEVNSLLVRPMLSPAIGLDPTGLMPPRSSICSGCCWYSCTSCKLVCIIVQLYHLTTHSQSPLLV